MSTNVGLGKRFKERPNCGKLTIEFPERCDEKNFYRVRRDMG